MDKILEALKHLLPEENVKEVSEAVAEMLADGRKDIEKDFNAKLEEAYSELTTELADAEKTAEKGYQEAWGIIQDLRNRLEKQNKEFESALEEGYEEAYQLLQQEKSKNETVSSDLYDEYDKRLAEVKEWLVEKIDQFLKHQGGQIYEQARRDVQNDPRMAEHKVALDRIVDIAVGYASDDDFAFASNSKLEEMTRSVDQLKSQVKLLEGRNIKISTENAKLNEQVRAAAEVITEARQVAIKGGQKERNAKGRNASGRGNLVNEGIVPEYRNDAGVPADNEAAINENSSLYQMQVLAGVKKPN